MQCSLLSTCESGTIYNNLHVSNDHICERSISFTTFQRRSSVSSGDYHCSKISHKKRRRTNDINQAFEDLKVRIPNLPKNTKLPKIKILKLAIDYINHLTAILNANENSITAAEEKKLFFEDRATISKIYDKKFFPHQEMRGESEMNFVVDWKNVPSGSNSMDLNEVDCVISRNYEVAASQKQEVPSMFSCNPISLPECDELSNVTYAFFERKNF